MDFTLSLVDKITANAKTMGGAVDSLADKMGGAVDGLGKLTQSMDGAGGSSAGLQAELAEMTGGLSILVEAAAAVGVAFGAVVVAGAAMAIEANTAKQKLTGVFDALGEGQISGKETIAMLDDLGDKFGATREQLTPFAKGFLTLGITGKEQLEGLTAAAAGLDAMTAGAGAKFTALYGKVNAAAETGQKLKLPFAALEKQLKAAGLNIGDLATKMNMSKEALAAGLKSGSIDASKFATALTDAAGTKGAGALALQGRSLSAIWSKFQENIMKMFEDIDVGPSLEQVKSLFDIFGQGKASGQALTAGIGGFFKQVFALATKVVPYIKHFLLDLVILGLKAYIGLKPIIAWIKNLASNQTVINVFWSAVKGIGTALAVVGAVVAVVVVAAVAFAGALLGIQIAIVAVIGSIISFVLSANETFGKWVAGAAEMAGNFVQGLIDGITAGASKVIGAVKDLASGAKNAFKSVLGINSPSKEMAKLGKFAGDGVAVGLDSSTSTVASSAGDLGGSAAAGAAGGMAGGSGGGGSGMTITVEAGAIVIQGGGGSAMDLTEQAVSLLFERIALSQGLG